MIYITKVCSDTNGNVYRVWIDMKEESGPIEFAAKKDALSHAYWLARQHETEVRSC